MDKSKSFCGPASTNKPPPGISDLIDETNFKEIKTIKISILIWPNVKNTCPVWQKTVTKVFSYLQKAERFAAIIPYTGKEIPVITEYSHFPDMNMDLEEDYCIFKR